MRDLMQVLKAMADENRVRILCALADGELCVCQVIEFLDLSPSTVSKHLAILRNAGLVDSRKQGRWVHYRLPDNHASSFPSAITGLLLREAGQTEKGNGDASRIEAIRKMDVEALCRELPHEA